MVPISEISYMCLSHDKSSVFFAPGFDFPSLHPAVIWATSFQHLQHHTVEADQLLQRQTENLSEITAQINVQTTHAGPSFVVHLFIRQPELEDFQAPRGRQVVG